MSPSAREELSALLDLITNATTKAIAEYEKNGSGIPSLKEQHALDNDGGSLGLRMAIRQLRGACEQLCATLAPPTDTLLSRTLSMYEPTCMRLVTEAGVVDALVDHPNGLHVSELGRRTGIEQGKLAHILRFLSMKHCFVEVGADVFANSRLSWPLLSTTPMASLIGIWANEFYEGARNICETYRDPQYGSSYAPERSPLMIFFNNRDGTPNRTFFDWMVNDKTTVNNKTMLERFNHAMAVSNTRWTLTQDMPWHKYFPTNGAKPKLCDIGGGVGFAAMELTRQFPDIHITVQDTRQVISHAPSVWQRDCPDAMKRQQVDFVPFNFLTDKPVLNHDIYYIRHVIHDWPDAEVVKILQLVCSAMTANNVMLIHQFILSQPHVKIDQNWNEGRATQSAPYPLIESYGAGNLFEFQMDLTMLMAFNAKERSVAETVELGEKAGLKFETFWDCCDYGILVFRKA